jgi:serine/threonine protein kinase
VRDRETGERLALKRLHRIDDRSVLRRKREFRSLANINHRNVIKLYDLGRSNDAWFLTMEYLDGAELLRHLDTNPSITATLTGAKLKAHADDSAVERVASTFLQLANGVSALHQAGVLHRDLKPSNVIVARDRVVLVDFGLAVEMGDNAATVTMNGEVAGTARSSSTRLHSMGS